MPFAFLMTEILRRQEERNRNFWKISPNAQIMMLIVLFSVIVFGFLKFFS